MIAAAAAVAYATSAVAPIRLPPVVTSILAARTKPAK